MCSVTRSSNSSDRSGTYPMIFLMHQASAGGLSSSLKTNSFRGEMAGHETYRLRGTNLICLAHQPPLCTYRIGVSFGHRCFVCRLQALISQSRPWKQRSLFSFNPKPAWLSIRSSCLNVLLRRSPSKEPTRNAGRLK